MRILFLFAILCSWLQGYPQNKMITLPGGTFKPLANWEIIPETEKKVYQIKSFQLSRYEVTNREYVQFLNDIRPDSNKMESYCCRRIPPGIQFDKMTKDYYCAKEDQNIPVTNVSWYGASAYCQWKGGRLPTDLEWFYAAAGGKSVFPYNFSGSDVAREVAVFNTRRPQPVGSKKPNSLGIYDLSGNVSEWTNTSKESSIIFPYKKFVDEELKLISCGNWRSLQDLFLDLNNLGCFMSPVSCIKSIGFRMAHD